jgi:hypothetical protein
MLKIYRPHQEEEKPLLIMSQLLQKIPQVVKT